MNDTPSILIVDDRPLNLQILGNLLQDERYRITVATSGSKALALVENHVPDIILLDIEMPEMNGYDVCHRLKENPATREVPVIFLTARSAADDIVTGFSCGAVDYITKPFNKEELLARVRTHIALKRSREEVSRAYGELKVKESIINSDLKKARDIQSNIISLDRSALSGIDVSIFFRPLIEVGGDIYDITRLDEGVYRIFIADANGHGVQAALLTMLIKSEYDKLKHSLSSPGDIMRSLNRLFYAKYYRLVVLFTACIIDCDINKRSITVSNAGHPYPYVLSDSGLRQAKVMGPMVGVKSVEEYHDGVFPFNAGDILLLFTDGIYEDLLTRNGTVSLDQVESIFSRHHGNDARSCEAGIMADIRAAHGDFPFTDDMTLIAVRIP